MHPGSGTMCIVFGVSRSKVKVTGVKLHVFTKMAITSLVFVVETRNKNQNVGRDELYNPGTINRK